VLFIAAGGKFITAKKYSALWTSQNYENLMSAPAYFCDSAVTWQPALF
jgi:hypothetical protein